MSPIPLKYLHFSSHRFNEKSFYLSIYLSIYLCFGGLFVYKEREREREREREIEER